MKNSLPVKIRPLTASRWPDFEKLMGPRGGMGGCWCMWWRLPRKRYETQKGSRNKSAMRRIVKAGPPPGVLAYAGREAVGWCALAPRQDYVALENSRVLAPPDTTDTAQPVWSVVCFYIAKPWRRKGVSTALLRGAAEFARKRGARILEGYPVDPQPGKVASMLPWAYTGLPQTFQRAGFGEIARRSPTRPIMRKGI